MLDSRETEIRQNYDFFQEVVTEAMEDHAGEIALLRNREIVGYFPNAAEAVKHGTDQFGDLPFSVQRVIDRPIDIGFLSHAANHGIAV